MTSKPSKRTTPQSDAPSSKCARPGAFGTRSPGEETGRPGGARKGAPRRGSAFEKWTFTGRPIPAFGRIESWDPKRGKKTIVVPHDRKFLGILFPGKSAPQEPR